MDKKLTLKLNEDVIVKAKKYASDKNISLSRLIEQYLNSVVSKKNKKDFEISPFIRSISSGTQIPSDIDYKKEYSDYLMKKYQ